MESYKRLEPENQRHFVSRVIDLLLFSSYFYIELKALVETYESKEENVQKMRRTDVSFLARPLQEVLVNREKVQPKEDYTLTAKYKTEREIKGILPFENIFPFGKPGLSSSITRLYRRIF